LIDKPEDGRLYEAIPAAGKYLAKIVESIRTEFSNKAEQKQAQGNELLGGEGDALVDVVDTVERPANLEKVRAIVAEIVASETAKEKERKRGDFVLAQIRRANTALIEAANGIAENTERAGVASQLDAIQKSLVLLRNWLNGKAKH